MSNHSIIEIKNRKTVENKKAIKSVQAILSAQFPGLEESFIDNLPINIFSSKKNNFKYRLFVSTDNNGTINGFLIFSFFPRYNFFYLDNMAVAKNLTSQGIGKSLYVFLRNLAKEKDALGIFFECINDDKDISECAANHAQNCSRLKFYERFGARPIANNLYSLKVHDKSNSTLLIFDPLDIPITLTRDLTRKIAKIIILNKYSDYCPPEYIKKVLMSFKDNPVKMREPRYTDN